MYHGELPDYEIRIGDPFVPRSALPEYAPGIGCQATPITGLIAVDDRRQLIQNSPASSSSVWRHAAGRAMMQPSRCDRIGAQA